MSLAAGLYSPMLTAQHRARASGNDPSREGDASANVVREGRAERRCIRRMRYDLVLTDGPPLFRRAIGAGGLRSKSFVVSAALRRAQCHLSSWLLFTRGRSNHRWER